MQSTAASQRTWQVAACTQTHEYLLSPYAWAMQGMPHKVYHGRTGVVWNITKRSVGVEVNKQVQTMMISSTIILRCAASL